MKKVASRGMHAHCQLDRVIQRYGEKSPVVKAIKVAILALLVAKGMFLGESVVRRYHHCATCPSYTICPLIQITERPPT